MWVFNRLDHKKIMLAFPIARAYSARVLRSHREIPTDARTLKKRRHTKTALPVKKENRQLDNVLEIKRLLKERQRA